MSQVSFLPGSSARRAMLTSLVLFIAMTMSAARAAGEDQVAATTQPSFHPADLPLVISGLDEKGGGITLVPGTSRLIKTRVPVRTVDLPQADVAQVNAVTATDLVLTARKPGTAQLVIVDDSGHSQTLEVTVVSDVEIVKAQLKKLLPDAPVQLSVANGALVLHGRVASAQIADQAMQIAAPYAAKVINLLEIGGGRQVTLHVRFAEVSRTATTNLGVNFGVSGSGGFGANTIAGIEPFGTGGTPPLLAVPSPGVNVTAFGHLTIGKTAFDLFVQALRENDLLRVLAEPNLTVLSGKRASFLAGGEFPIPVPQSSGAGGSGTAITIAYKEYGIRLSFMPVVLGDGRIRLEVSPEVSDLDFTHNVSFGGFIIPALTTRNATTTVELNEGETLSLAGLLNSRVSANKQVLPVLGDLPIIGALFRSVRYERDQTELVVLVTPFLAEGMRPGEVPELPGEHWRYPSEGELFWRRDLGGPASDTDHVPSASAPPRFHGAYGFSPANPGTK